MVKVICQDILTVIITSKKLTDSFMILRLQNVIITLPQFPLASECKQG